MPRRPSRSFLDHEVIDDTLGPTAAEIKGAQQRRAASLPTTYDALKDSGNPLIDAFLEALETVVAGYLATEPERPCLDGLCAYVATCDPEQVAAIPRTLIQRLGDPSFAQSVAYAQLISQDASSGTGSHLGYSLN